MLKDGKVIQCVLLEAESSFELMLLQHPLKFLILIEEHNKVFLDAPKGLNFL